MLDLPDIPWVAVDTETSGLHPDDGARVACVALAYLDESGRMWSTALPFDQGVRDKFPTQQLELGLFGESVDPNLPREAWDELFAWILQRMVVMHNGKYDCMMMRAGTRHWPGCEIIGALLWDTMVASRQIWPREDVGLDVTMRRLGLGGKKGLEEVKAWLARHKYPKERYDLVPWDIIRQYVLTDAEDTATLYVHQQEELQVEFGDDDVLHDRIDREIYGLLPTLYAMEQRGVSYDAEESIRIAVRLEAEADELEAKLPFRLNEKSVIDYFIRQQGLVADRYTEKTGKPSLDEQQRRDWIREGHPWVAEWDAVIKKRKAVSMWYRGYAEKLGADGRLRTVFRQTRVKSGRMSVGRVQLQAMPKETKASDEIIPVRKLIVPGEGKVLWNLDLSQAELRVASRYSKCMAMLEMLAAGVDQHAETTKNILHVTPDSPDWKVKRDIGKRLNFSGIFQIGPDHFQYILAKMADIHLDIEECQSIVYGWRNLYPEFGRYYNKSKRLAETQGWVPILPRTPLEFKSYFSDRDYPKTAWNRVVQQSLAEFFKLWMIETERLYPGAMVLTVHDSLLLEFEPGEGEVKCPEIAKWGAETASNLFDIEMKVDIDLWQQR